MKTLVSGIVPSFIVVLLYAATAFAASAPTYPGLTLKGEQVVRDAGGEGRSKTVVWDVYYAKDSKTKVTAFYKGKGYKTTKDEPAESILARRGEDSAAGWSVIVKVPQNDISTEDLFGPLEDEVMQQGGMQSAGLTANAHTQKDLDEVKANIWFFGYRSLCPRGFHRRPAQPL